MSEDDRSGYGPPRPPGCWDHACPYRTDKKPRVGTNGGCRCDDCKECGGYARRRVVDGTVSTVDVRHRPHCSKYSRCSGQTVSKE